MSLLEDLKTKQEKVIDDKVVEFAEEMEDAITKSAENGYAGYNYNINNENPDKHIMCSKTFAEKLEALMDGVKVEYEVKKKVSLLGLSFYEHYINFSWND